MKKPDIQAQGTIGLNNGLSKEAVAEAAKTEEQKLFIKSFEMALPFMEKFFMRRMPRKFSHFKQRMQYYDRWNAESIAYQFILCSGKMSALTRSEREFICAIGAKAKEIYDNKLNIKKEESNE